MDLALIKTFLEVSETGSFVAASERLFVTQSAVSLRVQRLEEMLGQPLFQRSKTGAEITPSGREFVAYAQSMLRTWEQARQHVAVPDGFSQNLNIGAQGSLWPRLGSRFVDALRNAMPDLGLRAEMGTAESLNRAMVEGVMQIMLTVGVHLQGMAEAQARGFAKTGHDRATLALVGGESDQEHLVVLGQLI